MEENLLTREMDKQISVQLVSTKHSDFCQVNTITVYKIFMVLLTLFHNL